MPAANAHHRTGTARKVRRQTHSIRFLDPEWNRIRDLAEARGLSASEFVRHATLAALADGHDRPGDRLAPLIETTFLATHILASQLREEMLRVGEQDKLDAMIAEARTLQAKLLDKASD